MSSRATRARKLLVTAVGAWCALVRPEAGAAQSPLCPDHLFGDHMVLQRDRPVPVWGAASPGSRVTVSLAGRRRTVTADDRGRWQTTLDPLGAGGPWEMTISADTTLTFHDVLIGEVWLCSGQSNMEFLVQNARGAEREIAAADRPAIRQLLVPRRTAGAPEADLAGDWAVCSTRTVGHFTAVGYEFGKELNDTLGVPVGLIDASVGGTRIEEWMAREALAADPALRPIVEEYDHKEETFRAATAKYQQAVRDYTALAASVAPGDRHLLRAPHPPIKSFTPPCALFNGMINPLVPVALRGVIWYQGEQNTDRPELYRTLFPTLIRDWRARWGRELPFLYVQLANYQPHPGDHGEGGWAALREAQAEALALPGTGMAVAIDVGESHDIHPKDKVTVGHRLALLALAGVYGRPEEAQSPRFASLRIEEGRARIAFTGAERGLMARGEPLEGFTIAGEDSVFVPARAEIDGSTVIAWSPQVPRPVAVRYGWADDPQVNLYGLSGLPVAPFRTDRPH